MRSSRMMGRGMMPQMGNMPLPQASMVASGDGGVIVLFGDRLIKYDKNLKLVKEVSLAPDRDMGSVPAAPQG